MQNEYTIRWMEADDRMLDTDLSWLPEGGRGIDRRAPVACANCGMTYKSVALSNAQNGHRSIDPICCEVNV